MSLLEDAFRGRVTADAVPVRGFRPTPLVGWRGNVLKFFADPLDVMLRAHAEFGDLVALNDRRPELLFAFGPEHNRPLLTDRESYAPFITTAYAPPGSAFARLYHQNVFCIAGDAHAREREVVVPPFHRKRVDRWTRALVEVADDALRPLTVGDVIDAPHVMQGYTLEAMIRVVFGLDPATRRAEVERFRGTLVETLDSVGSPAAALLPLDLPLTPYRRVLRLAERFEADVLRLAATASPEGALPELRAEPESWLPARLFALLTAGHETTFTALSWTLALLAQHPAVLAELTDALRTLARDDAPAEALRAVPLLDHVIKESLRIFPPAAYGARVVTRPVELGGVRLPVGCVVIFSHYVTQRTPSIFTDPERFDPSRWASLRPSPYEYLPFGGGPRACPGAEFARLEMAVMLARFLTRFWPEVPDGATIEPRLRITLRPHPGLPLRLLPSGARPPRPARIRGGWRRAVRA